MQNARPLSASTKLAFGLTSIVENIKFQVYEIFLIFYYAQVLGLAGSLAGLAIAVAIVADAVIDPLIGSYSDSFRGRFGRRHTLMLAAILPTGLLFFLLFSPPAGLGQAGLFAWLLSLCLAVRIAGSFYSVPAAATGAELTSRAADRASLGIWRQATAAAVQAFLTWAVFAFVFVATPEYARGQENPDNYPKFALFVAALLMVCALMGALGTRRRIAEFEASGVAAQPRAFAVGESLRAVWRALADVRNFRVLFLGLLFAGVMGSYFRALNLHLGTYFWEFSTRQTGAWLLATQVATFAAALSARFIVERVEPRNLYATGFGLMVASYILPPALRLLDLLPENGSPLLVNLLYGANVVVGFGTGFIMVCSMVLFAEVADEYAWRKGESRTGMLLAFLPLGNKMASSVGKLLAGIVVQLIALPAGTKAAVPASAVRELGVAAVGITFVAGAIGLAFFLQYRLTRRQHAEIVADLQARRGAGQTDPAQSAVPAEDAKIAQPASPA